MLRIITLNVRGLRNENKRRSIFNYYRKRADIICLQETHSTEVDEKCWRNEWGGIMLFSHGESNARGVAILVCKGCPVMTENIKNDYKW